MNLLESLSLIEGVEFYMEQARDIYYTYTYEVNSGIIERDLKYEKEFELYVQALQEILHHINKHTINTNY